MLDDIYPLEDGVKSDYVHSTISNVDSDSPNLWAHTLLSLTYLILALIIMRRFSSKLNFETEDDSARTLMVSYIPRDKCFKNTVTQHFKYVSHPVVNKWFRVVLFLSMI